MLTGFRNTSTSVEKTQTKQIKKSKKKKHLHERGEDSIFELEWVAAVETPPRAWRRPLSDTFWLDWLRNTSTSVEKTSLLPISASLRKKHLHERGEDLFDKNTYQTPQETPPRAWRRLNAISSFSVSARNTSTSVEKTGSARMGNG